MSKFRKGLFKTANKRKSAVSLGVCLCLALMGFALVSATFAEPWFSESNYAYFFGKVSSWSPEWIDESFEGTVIVGSNTRIGDDPDAVVLLDTPGGHSGIWTGFEVMGSFWCHMDSVSLVRFNYGGKDFYMSGTWTIAKRLFITTENITYIKPFIAGLNITNIAIITAWQNVTHVKDFLAAELEAANITVFNTTEDTNYSWDGPLEIGGVVVGVFNMVVYYGYDPEWDQESICVEIPNAGVNHAPGEIYVTGNWTDFTGYIEGLETFSGEIMDHLVKYTPEEPTIAMIDVNHNRKIDIKDVYFAACAYGSAVGSPRYDSILDFNSDSVINIIDLAAIAKNFGKTY